MAAGFIIGGVFAPGMVIRGLLAAAGVVIGMTTGPGVDVGCFRAIGGVLAASVVIGMTTGPDDFDLLAGEGPGTEAFDSSLFSPTWATPSSSDEDDEAILKSQFEPENKFD